MTKPERIRDDETETAREAKKRRNSLGEALEVGPPMCEPDDLHQARPEMRGVGETNGVDEMTKAGGAAEELPPFTPKSPISKPYIPDELADPTAPEILAAFEHANAKYKAKLGRRSALFTSEHKRKAAPSCLFHDERLHHIREPAKKAVLHAAKSLVRLSSSVEGEPLTRCCGLWTDWDKERKTGIILTTAHLIRQR